jgi:hypothetical protein
MTNQGETGSLVFKAFKWVGGLLLGGLIAAVVLGGLFTGWPIDRTWKKVRWSAEHGSLKGTPTCDDPAWLNPIEIKSATPFYLPDPNDHPVAQTYDDNSATAWWQEWPEPPGYSRIAWTFQRPETVKLVCLIGGWARDATTLQTVGSPKQIKLSSTKGCKEKTFTLPDYVTAGGMVKGGAWSETSIQFECEHTKVLRLWIESIYPPLGSHSQPDHLAISEVAFYG